MHGSKDKDDIKENTMSKWALEEAKLSADGTWSSDTKAKVLSKLKEYEDLIMEIQRTLAQTSKALNDTKVNGKGSPSLNGSPSRGGGSASMVLNTSVENVTQTPTMKVNRLDPNTPVFYGKIDENAEDWIALVSCNFRLAGIEPNQRIYAIANYVKGAAQCHYLRYLSSTNEANRNVEAFFKEILASTNHKLREERAKDKLDNLRQTGDYDEYQFEFQKLATETKYSEEELKRRFKNGLKGQTKRDIHIKQDDLKTLTDMMQLAARLEQNCVINRKDTNKVNYTNGGYKKGRNHNKTYNGSSNRNKNSNNKDKVCYNCGKTGHIKTECRSRGLNKNQSTNNQNQSQSPSNKSKMKCYKCGNLGHIAKNCRVKSDKRVNLIEENNDDQAYWSKFPVDAMQNKSYARKREERINIIQGENNDNKLMIVSGCINGVFMEKIVLDIGATVSIMSRKVQLANWFKLKKSNKRVLLANNVEAKVYGETNSLKVNIENHITMLRFTVIEGCEYDILLGMDYFNKTKVGIFPSQRLLKFPDGYVFLDKDSKNRQNKIQDVDFELDELYNTQTITEDDEDDMVAPEEFLEWNPCKKDVKPEIQLSEAMRNEFIELAKKIYRCSANNYMELGGGFKSRRI